MGKEGRNNDKAGTMQSTQLQFQAECPNHIHEGSKHSIKLRCIVFI